MGRRLASARARDASTARGPAASEPADARHGPFSFCFPPDYPSVCLSCHVLGNVIAEATLRAELGDQLMPCFLSRREAARDRTND